MTAAQPKPIAQHTEQRPAIAASADSIRYATPLKRDIIYDPRAGQAALRWWQQKGNPGIERFGLTVAAEGQSAWLDDPAGAWPV